MDYFLLTDNLTKATGKLDNLTNGNGFCRDYKILEWNISLPSLVTSIGMFAVTKNIKRFNIDLSSVVDASEMFNYSSIEEFKSSLLNCKKTNQMFRGASQLHTFESELPLLNDGSWMFHYFSKINHWDIELPNLVNGSQMFGWYSKLTYFHSETPKLENGYAMFDNNTELTSFKGNLSSLKKGINMFTLCKLDLESIKNIAETINDLTSQSLSSNEGTIVIGMSADIKDLQETADALAMIRSKGWTVTEQYN